MPLINDKLFTLSYLKPLSFLIIFLFLTGCAAKPWTAPVAETATVSTAQLIDHLIARDKTCGNGLDGDLDLFYTSPLKKKALSGYLQFSMPSFFNFVVTNPLGQPLFIVAGDKKSFQTINTIKRKYLSGRLRSFFLLNDIPTFFLSGRWGEWITGRNSLSSQDISEIRQDRAQRGVWVSFQHRGQGPVRKTHLLLDQTNDFFLARFLEDGSGKIVAEITYSNWMEAGTCKQPLDIDITGLNYGTSINLRLSNTRLSEETKVYQLSPPPGYSRQFMP